MPRIIEYNVVQQTMSELGFVSLYHNSGAFGFAPEQKVTNIGWIGPDDPTIRETARSLVRKFPPPYQDSLTAAFDHALPHLPGNAWLMPKSHWHYEMHFGNRELLETLLPTIDIDPAILRDRNNGSAIEFLPVEHPLLTQSVGALLDGLIGSDFLIAFPDATTLCTIHHHRQLWWQTIQNGLISLWPEPG